jgi:hypothetical protein
MVEIAQQHALGERESRRDIFDGRVQVRAQEEGRGTIGASQQPKCDERLAPIDERRSDRDGELFGEGALRVKTHKPVDCRALVGARSQATEERDGFRRRGTAFDADA